MLLGASVAVLASCGGGSGNGPESSSTTNSDPQGLPDFNDMPDMEQSDEELAPQIAVGTIVDAVVDGLQYTSGSLNGITKDGAFEYEIGSTIQFSVGSVFVGEAKGASLVSPLDFQEDSTNAARFLQTLDYDGKPGNGITITGSTRALAADLPANFVKTLDQLSSDAQIKKITSATLGGSRGLISTEAAVTHLNSYATYAEIDRISTGDKVHGGSWNQRDTSDFSYGYDQPLGEDWSTGQPQVHAGIDIRVPTGVAVNSLTNGTVTRTKPSIGAVYVRNDNQPGTLVYMHLSKIEVKKDAKIKVGEKMGLSGDRGVEPRSHLHIEWLKDESYSPNESEPTAPKEISAFNQGIQETATDLTYDLRDLNLESSGVADIDLTGIWVAQEERQVSTGETLTPVTFTSELTIGINGAGTLTSVMSLYGDCGTRQIGSIQPVSATVDGTDVTALHSGPLTPIRRTCGDFAITDYENNVTDITDDEQYSYQVSLSGVAKLVPKDICVVSIRIDGEFAYCAIRNPPLYRVDESRPTLNSESNYSSAGDCNEENGIGCPELNLWPPCSLCGNSGRYDREWFGDNTSHLAQDYPAFVDDSVRAVADGRVYKIYDSIAGFGGDQPVTDGPAVVIEHKKNDGTSFFALYGHVAAIAELDEDDFVTGNNIIGKVTDFIYSGQSWPHLHFGIWDAEIDFPTQSLGYGSVRKFVNPIPFLETTKYQIWKE